MTVAAEEVVRSSVDVERLKRLEEDVDMLMMDRSVPSRTGIFVRVGGDVGVVVTRFYCWCGVAF